MRVVILVFVAVLIAFFMACSPSGNRNVARTSLNHFQNIADEASYDQDFEGVYSAPQAEGISTLDYLSSLPREQGISAGEFTLFSLDSLYFPILQHNHEN